MGSPTSKAGNDGKIIELKLNGSQSSSAARELSFPDAMRAVMEGKKVARRAWNNADWCGLNEGRLSVYREDRDKVFDYWNIIEADMFNDDWFAIG